MVGLVNEVHLVHKVLNFFFSERVGYLNYQISLLPLAITPDPLTHPDKVITDPPGIKETTVFYFQELYRRTTRPPQNKPWMFTPSVTQVADTIRATPFLWPQPMSLSHIVAKGNARPTPGLIVGRNGW